MSDYYIPTYKIYKHVDKCIKLIHILNIFYKQIRSFISTYSWLQLT